VCDGRPPGRYNGTAPEPNPKLRSGHMLGSKHVFFRTLIDADTKTLKGNDDIKKGRVGGAWEVAWLEGYCPVFLNGVYFAGEENSAD